jgi:fructoselysine-6-P-deglycase FrlB-like protein
VEGVRLLERVGERGPVTVAVSNNEGSRIARGAGSCLALGIPADHGVAIKSFGASLLALLYLGTRLAGRSPESWQEAAGAAAAAAASLLAEAGTWRDAGRSMSDDIRAMVTLARGPGSTAGREAALLMNELAKVPAWFEEAGQFRHGIVELSGPSVLVGLVVPSGRTAPLQVSLALELARTGAPVLATATTEHAPALAAAGARVIEVPEVPEDYAAVPHVLPFQYLAIGWAERRGFVPGTFRFVSGVIRTEGCEGG